MTIRNNVAAGSAADGGGASRATVAPDLPPFPIPRWVLILIAVVVVVPILYVLSFAPAANLMAVGISARSRIKRVEIVSAAGLKADVDRFMFWYGPVVSIVNEVPIFYPYFMVWARAWQVSLIEYKS